MCLYSWTWDVGVDISFIPPNAMPFSANHLDGVAKVPGSLWRFGLNQTTMGPSSELLISATLRVRF